MKKGRAFFAVTLLVVVPLLKGLAEQPGDFWTNAQPVLERDQVTGDWLGSRPLMSDHGLEIFGNYSVEVWGNTCGGLKTGAVYTGLLNFGATLDLEKAVGWKGASLSTNWSWLSGRDPSQDLVGNFLTVSSISGFNTVRMFDLWFQQNLFDDKISIRLGQLAADSEFAISDYAGVFINATFGWPAFTYMNTPNGGPAFPIGAPGARVAWNLTDWFTFQSAAFEGNIFAQNVNRHGFRWQLSAQNGYTFLSEAQFRWNHRDGDTRLPGQLKPGVWFQTGRNADALASSTGSGNSGFYLVLDQMLYREPCETTDAGLAKDGKSTVRDKTFKTSIAKDNNDQGLGCFGRISFAPADRNFISFYFDTGLTYKGLIPSRDDDTLGVGFGYAQLSHGAQNTLSAGDSTPAGAEMVLELTYQTQLTHWLVVQPDLQYVIHPGGTSDPGNAFVIGARATVTF